MGQLWAGTGCDLASHDIHGLEKDASAPTVGGVRLVGRKDHADPAD
jgi:hypothetical protein